LFTFPNAFNHELKMFESVIAAKGRRQ